MIRRLPLVATFIVLVAVAIMVGLGVWQLHRADWKEALLVQYGAALENDEPVAWPTDPAHLEDRYYRRSQVECENVSGFDAIAGRNAEDETGWVQIARCLTPEGNPAAIQLGWSRDPNPVEWAGGTATGRIARYGEGVRLVADPPLAGLAANAAPDPRELPNNHVAYAFQWFFFAITALIIYGIAVRKRLKPA